MSTIDDNPPSRPKIGLCLTGGAITGAIYQVGCLAAFEEALEGFDAADLDVYIGASAGATVSLALAGGYSAGRLYRALLNPADDFFALQRAHLLRLDRTEFRRVRKSITGAARRLVASAVTKPLAIDLWTELERFFDSLPAGLFTMDAYASFLEDFCRRRRIADRFSGLPRTLRIVAHDLDAGKRTIFGGEGFEDVSVPLAVAAASAFPPVFAPVRIDGRDYVDAGIGEVGHADVALAEGCNLIIVINPVVPIESDPEAAAIPTGHGTKRRLRDKGLLWVASQSARMRSEGRFRALMERFRGANPDVRVLLIEPDARETKLHLYSPMNFAARRVIMEDAFAGTAARLRQEDSPFRLVLEEAGFRLTPAPTSVAPTPPVG